MSYNPLKGIWKGITGGGLVTLLALILARTLTPDAILKFVPEGIEEMTVGSIIAIGVGWLRNYLKVKHKMPL